VAASLVDVVEAFKDLRSCDEADIEIATQDRTYRKRTPLQEGLSALVGIYMVTAGCPILDKLRPLVYTHAPFGSLEETTYRALAMYSLAQCLRKRVHVGDAGLNALVRLDCYAQFTNRLLLRKGLGDIERLFHPYLEA
jgi:hypothetical protein